MAELASAQLRARTPRCSCVSAPPSTYSSPSPSRWPASCGGRRPLPSRAARTCVVRRRAEVRDVALSSILLWRSSPWLLVGVGHLDQDVLFSPGSAIAELGDDRDRDVLRAGLLRRERGRSWLPEPEAVASQLLLERGELDLGGLRVPASAHGTKRTLTVSVSAAARAGRRTVRVRRRLGGRGRARARGEESVFSRAAAVRGSASRRRGGEPRRARACPPGARWSWRSACDGRACRLAGARRGRRPANAAFPALEKTPPAARRAPARRAPAERASRAWAERRSRIVVLTTTGRGRLRPRRSAGPLADPSPIRGVAARASSGRPRNASIATHAA